MLSSQEMRNRCARGHTQPHSTLKNTRFQFANMKGTPVEWKKKWKPSSVSANHMKAAQKGFDKLFDFLPLRLTAGSARQWEGKGILSSENNQRENYMKDQSAGILTHHLILCFCFYHFFTLGFKIRSLFFHQTTTKQCKISIWPKKKLRKYKHQKNILELTWSVVTQVYSIFQRKTDFSSWCPELSWGARDISVAIWVSWVVLSIKATGLGGTLERGCVAGRERY